MHALAFNCSIPTDTGHCAQNRASCLLQRKAGCIRFLGYSIWYHSLHLFMLLRWELSLRSYVPLMGASVVQNVLPVNRSKLSATNHYGRVSAKPVLQTIPSGAEVNGTLAYNWQGASSAKMGPLTRKQKGLDAR